MRWINKEQPHLWCDFNEYIGAWSVGITQEALDEIGDITFVEAREQDRYRKGDVFAVVESQKGVWELKSPFDGYIVGRVRTEIESFKDWRNSIISIGGVDFNKDEWEES